MERICHLQTVFTLLHEPEATVNRSEVARTSPKKIGESLLFFDSPEIDTETILKIPVINYT
jgi:hypothetical protein